MKKQLTIDDLALIVNKGFTETQKEINAVKEEINGVKDIQKNMLEELNATHEDVRYIRNTVNMLVQSDVAHEAALEELKVRVSRLEQKAGLAS